MKLIRILGSVLTLMLGVAPATATIFLGAGSYAGQYAYWQEGPTLVYDPRFIIIEVAGGVGYTPSGGLFTFTSLIEQVAYAGGHIIHSYGGVISLTTANCTKFGCDDAAGPGISFFVGDGTGDPNTAYSKGNFNITFDRGQCSDGCQHYFVLASDAAGTLIEGAPEPSTWATMMIGFLGIGLALRRRIFDLIHTS